MGDYKDGTTLSCVACGARDGETALSWLRTDASQNLGVCSDCPEWVASWDRELRRKREATQADLALEEMIRQASLPSLSSVLLEIYDMLSSDTAGAAQIARLIETDAGLSARTLRLANSAYYGLRRKISTVSEAIARVGPFDLWWLLLATEVKSLFYGIDRSLADMDGFWRHSLMVACASRTLSERHRIGNPSQWFVAGLLHDSGKLMFLNSIPVEYESVLRAAAKQEKPLSVLEREVLGFDHARAAARLLELWQLPARLIDPIESHHQPYRRLTELSLVAVANDLVHGLETDSETRSISGIESEAVVASTEALFKRLASLVL